jgi:flagellin-like hook-associated protein FlgL
LLSELNHGLGVHPADGTDFRIVRSDGTSLDIDVSGAQTISDVLDVINNHPGNLDPATRVHAALAAYGNGLELTDDNPAGVGSLSVERTDTSVAARELGLVAPDATQTGPTETAAFASAAIALDPPNDLNTALVLTGNVPGTTLNGVDVVFSGGLVGDVALVNYDDVARQLEIRVDPTQTRAITVRDAIVGDGNFTAALDTDTDPTNDGTGIMNVAGVVATTDGGVPHRITGTDANPLQTEGVLNTLYRLHQALINNDVESLEPIVEMLDDDFARISFVRAEVGARDKGLDAMRRRLEDEDVVLVQSLSDEIDIDLVEAISNLTLQEASLEASLRTIARTYQLSLLDYL